MLKIENLHVAVEGKEILRGIDLTIAPGEIHALMGPNGSGKSTLAFMLAGREGYEIRAGSVAYDGRDLLAMPPEERAREGVFLAFQYPVEIPSVAGMYFLRADLNARRKHRGEEELDAIEFLALVRARMAELGMDESLLERSVNAGFSGGEKKLHEVLQMSILDPRLAILDETDSGLDIDALRTVAEGVNRLKRADRSVLVVTRYQRLLDHLVPDRVHVVVGGRVVRSGGSELALELEERGYGWLEEEAAIGAAEASR
ncbi:MAG: Fe-S cluster assembly ATPase SufC [Planctomycetota bacterium]